MNKNNTFISKAAGLYNLLGITEWASFKIMAMGTAIMFGGMGYTYGQNNAPVWASWIAFLAVILGYFSVDWGLNKLLKFYYDHRKGIGENEEENKIRKTLFWWTMTLIVFRFIASISMSFLSNTEVVNFATEDFNAGYFINNVNAQDSIRNKNLNALESQYSKLSDSENERLKKAQKDGRKIVANAVNLGSKWQKSSYKTSKFSWLESKANKDKKDKTYAASIRKAIDDSTKLVQAVYEKTKMAEVLYTTEMKDTSTLSAKAKILAMGEKKAADRDKQVSTRYYFLTVAVSMFGLLGWIGVYIRSLLRRAGVDYDRERTFSHVANQITNSWSEWMLIKLELWLKVDLDGDGTIGTVASNHSPKKRGLFKTISSIFTGTTPTTTTGTTATTTHGTTRTTPTTTTGTTAITTHETTAEETTPRVVVKPFSNRKTTPSETPTTTTTVVPPTPVPTGVSPVVDRKKTTPTKEIVVQITHGVGFVVHNGVKRDRTWVLKQLNAYKTRQKNYKAKGSDTTTVDANILLFTNYLVGIEEMEAESTT